MKVLYTSDIHAAPTHFSSMFSVAETEKVEAIIIGGDIIPHHLPESLRGFSPVEAHSKYIREVFIPKMAHFVEKRRVAVYLDLGNDDLFFSRPLLEQYNGSLFHLLHFKKTGLTDHVDIIGYMCVPPTPFVRKDLEKPDSSRQPYAPGNTILLKGHISKNGTLEDMTLDLTSPDTIEKDLERISEIIDKPFIFVSHSPPYQTPLDMLHNGIHVGSLSISAFIRHWAQKGKLIASLHGHIHESPVRSGSILSRIEGVLCINPGQGNGPGSRFRYVVFDLKGDRVLREEDIIQVGG